MKEDRMWVDIGTEKAELLKSYDFDIVGWQFVKRGKTRPWVLEFEHVRDTSLTTLRVELSESSHFTDN